MRNLALIPVVVVLGLVGHMARGAGEQPKESPKPVELEGVVVTATRTDTVVRDIPASVDLLPRERIESATPIAVDEVFKGMGGVDLQGSGLPGSAIKLSMRGLTTGYQSKRVLVMLDGRRLNDPYQGNAEFGLLPADSIERIEVVRGPGSALYGSGAMGGVVNIITRRGTENPFTRLRVAGGSHDTRYGRVSHGWKKGLLDYFVSGSYVTTDGYAKTRNGADRDWEAANVVANAGLQLGEDAQLRIFAGYYDGEGTDENSDREVEKDYVHGLYTLQWGSNKDAVLQVRAYRNGEDNIYDWVFPGRGVYDQETLGAEIIQSFWLGEAQQVTLGVEGRRESVDIDEVSGPIDESSSLVAGLVQDQVHLGDRFRVTAGLRADRDGDFGTEWSPRVGVLWQACDAAEVYASVNQAHRAPSLSDRFVRTEFNGMLFVGNPDLQPETLTAYEAGVRFRCKERVSVEAAAFFNAMDDSFDFVLDADGTFRNRNVTESETYGAEVSLRCRLWDKAEAFANYSHTEGEYVDFPAISGVDGNDIAYLAKNKAAAGMEFVCPLGATHAASCRYTDDRFGDAQNTAENRMDDHVVFDWRSRVPVGDQLVLTLNVDNIFDRGYQEFPGLDQPGRIVMVGAELTF